MLSLCVIALGGACVLPPPVDEATPDENRPPSIDPILPTADGQPVLLPCDGTPVVFLANITDPDVHDTLYYRFFIDYYRASAADLLAIDPVKAAPLPNGRERNATTQINARNATLQEDPGLVHVIELLVADRPFDDGNPDVDPSAVARVPVEGGLTTSYQWAVDPIVCN